MYLPYKYYRNAPNRGFILFHSLKFKSYIIMFFKVTVWSFFSLSLQEKTCSFQWEKVFAGAQVRHKTNKKGVPFVQQQVCFRPGNEHM